MPAVTREFRDIDLNFIPHPVSGDLSILKNVDAVKAAVKNVVMTDIYEKFFHPNFGSGVAQYLFELATPATQRNLENSIRSAIRAHEPRASLINVSVELETDENRFKATIEFAIDYLSTIETVDIFLERVR